MRRIALLFLLTLLTASGCQNAGEANVPAGQEPNPAATPTWRTDQLAAKRHRQFCERASRHDYPILFLGDSLTEGWFVTGMDVWKREYRPMNAGNFGLSADRTETMLWRLAHGELEGLSPKLVVLMIGTNNLKSGPIRHSPAQTAEGVEAVVDLIQRKLPETKILLLGILPRQPKYEWFPSARRETNRRIARLAQRDGVRWLNFSDRYLDDEGKLRKELYREDLLHLSAAGYEVWADAMRKTLREIMAEQEG
jgi:beta-glucosidase